MAIIAIEGVEFNVKHGLWDLEKKVSGRYLIDAYLILKNKAIKNNDKLSETIDYVDLYKICEKHMLKPVKLLETLAKNIADEICERLIEKGKVKIRISKMNPSLPTLAKRSFIEYSRSTEKRKK